MAFVNLPPNLKDMFYNLSDRISKLETGPNQAMYTAEAAQGGAQSATAIALSAQSVATQAEADAISAGIQANNAAAQATLAQTQATQAQTSANGKNTVTYSASTPSGLGTLTGDIWFQYQSPSYNIIGQWVWNGSAWQVSPIANTVIANLDAGKITTGTITSIEYNNGSGTFRVTPAGALTASSATITGTINATTGYFGNYSGGNYWSIGSSGITAVGTGTITGGLIQGSSITVPNSSAWKFAVDSAGSLQCVNANVNGTITTVSGKIASFNIDGNRLYTGNMNLNGTTGDLTAGAITGSSYTGSVSISGTGANLTTGAGNNITASGNLYAAGHTTTGAAANGYVNATTGLIARSTASSQRYKHDIVNLIDVPELDPTVLYELPVRAFRFNQGYLPETDERADVLVPGFIAEEVDAIYPAAADYNDGQVETWNDRMLIPGLLALIQDLNNRVKELEQNR